MASYKALGMDSESDKMRLMLFQLVKGFALAGDAAVTPSPARPVAIVSFLALCQILHPRPTL